MTRAHSDQLISVEASRLARDVYGREVAAHPLFTSRAMARAIQAVVDAGYLIRPNGAGPDEERADG